MKIEDFKEFSKRVRIYCPQMNDYYHRYSGKIGIAVYKKHKSGAEEVSVYFTEGEEHSLNINPIYLELAFSYTKTIGNANRKKIKEACLFLKEKDNNISNETIDFLKFCAFEKLANLQESSSFPTIYKMNYDFIKEKVLNKVKKVLQSFKKNVKIAY